MLAVLACVRSRASAEAKFAVADEAGPFMVLLPIAERIAVYETPDGVAARVRTVRVELTAGVAAPNVQLSEITAAGDLNIVLSLYEMYAGERAVRNDACARPRFGTPDDDSSLVLT